MMTWKNRVFTPLTLPSRILSYAKIVKGERNDEVENPCFYTFDTAEPHPILCKDSERRLQRQKKNDVFQLSELPNRIIWHEYMACSLCKTHST